MSDTPPKLSLRQFLFALFLACTMLMAYETYRLYQGFLPSHNMNSEMWAKWRREVNNLTSEDIVIIGSSRAFFDINLHLFKELTGKMPVNLAIEGGTPRITFQDIVDNTEFNGLILCGNSGDLFYATADSWMSNRVRKKFVNFQEDQTYASRFNQWVFEFPDSKLAYINSDYILKNIIENLPFPKRDSVRISEPWPQMIVMDNYRSVRMTDRFETDTSLQRIQKEIWFNPKDELDTVDEFIDSADAIINFYAENTQRFTERGGRIVYFLPPISGKYYTLDSMIYPREQYWDRLLKETKAIGYHFEDYPETRDMNPPEWSHLNKMEADEFTRFIVKQLQKDGFL